MAEGKKSFVLYMTQRPTFDGLSDEDAGKLIKTIFAYCGDEYPEPDGIVKYAFEIIKPVLKEDLKKYEEIRKAKSEGGKKHKGNQYTAKDTKSKRNTTEDTSKNGTNGTDIDIVIDIDNVNKEDKSSIVVNNVSKDTTAEVSDEASQAVIILPCLKGYNHKIFKEDIAYYQKLYPAVDIEQQLRNMLGWLESNPKNRKTEAGIKRFITSWLGRTQDKAPKVESQNIGFGEYDVVEGKNDKPHFGGFQMLGESDEEYEKRTGIKRYKPNKRN